MLRLRLLLACGYPGKNKGDRRKSDQGGLYSIIFHTPLIVWQAWNIDIVQMTNFHKLWLVGRRIHDAAKDEKYWTESA